MLDGAGGVYLDATATGIVAQRWLINPTVPSPNYSVFATLTKLAGPPGGLPFVLRDAGGGFYNVGYYDSDGWEIYRCTDLGPATELAFVDDTSWAAGQSKRIRASVNGNLIRLFADGVLMASAVDPTPLAAAGKPGIIPSVYSGAPTANTGWHLSNWLVTYE